MPQVFKIGSYWVYFWANENEPLEPIHVHVAQGAPSANATKIWITRAGITIPRSRPAFCGTSWPSLRREVPRWSQNGRAFLAKRTTSAEILSHPITPPKTARALRYSIRRRRGKQNSTA